MPVNYKSLSCEISDQIGFDFLSQQLRLLPGLPEGTMSDLMMLCAAFSQKQKSLTRLKRCKKKYRLGWKCTF